MSEYERTAQAMRAAMGQKVWKAYLLARNVHKNQKRKSGEPYIMHPVTVAKMLYDIGADRDTVCAAILHDTLEEGLEEKVLEERIHREFGDHVLYMVQALSKDPEIEDKLEQQSKYMQQIREAFEVDISVFFIKIADLFHNMKTIVALSPEKKAQWVKELKYDYLPLLSEFFHSVPLHYRDIYDRMMQEIQETIDEFDNSSPSAVE